MRKKTFSESIKPLNRESVSSSIMNMVTDYLLSKELKPGDKLPTESEFAEKLGVGRNSVREAIKMLSSLGIIEIKRGVGTFISRSMSASMINPLVLGLVFEQGASKELIELRLFLDIGVTELATKKATDEDIEEMEVANKKLREAAENNERDLNKLRDLDLNFHYTLLESTKNSLLAKIGKVIYTLFFTSIKKTVELDPVSGYKNHQLVIDAIKKKDEELARKVTRESLSFWIEILES